MLQKVKQMTWIGEDSKRSLPKRILILKIFTTELRLCIRYVSVIDV